MFTLRHTKQELFEGGIARGVTLAPVNTVADVLALEHLAVREYWDELHAAERAHAAGARARSSRRRGTPVAWSRPAPDRRRAHRRGARRAAAADRRRPRTARRRSRPARRLPLEGVKVADFSWIGVGPITAKALADHGATVVHVESDSRPTACASSARSRTTSPGINRCQFFGSFNTSKLSLQLNLKHPDGHRPRQAAARRGATSRSTRSPPARWPSSASATTSPALNPDIIMATTCLMGQTGPAARSPATATTPPRSAASTRSPAGTTARRPVRSTPTPTPSRRAS